MRDVAATHHDTHAPSGAALIGLTIGALGVVYGDIGTSPLYAFRETFHGHDLEVNRVGVFGACSLAFWALVIVITIKYLTLVMRADNHGEGGILALTALLPKMRNARIGALLVSLGILGTALLYGDGMITPAISVLSAVEGVDVATSALEHWVIPIAVAILAALFVVQQRGTTGVGRVFGPVMVVWFVVIGVLGVKHIVQEPTILKALNPIYVEEFFRQYQLKGFWALGSIFLVVTGGEALYADMGHFGRKPIQFGWYSFVFPALVLNYFGQGALLLREPESIENPFFHLAPEWAIWPMVILATVATVIASQALISGAFSLTVQAMQLDYLPRLTVRHTSTSQRGQVYVPIVNWILMLACIGLVIGFRSSTRLAAAYGIAVTMTMAITTLLLIAVARGRWNWSRAKTLAVGIPLLFVDLSFLGAQIIKIPHGGWFAIGVGIVQFTLMTTWRTGRRVVGAEIRRGVKPIDEFVADLPKIEHKRVPGTAVFLFKDAGMTPPALLVNLRHNKVLHDTVLLVSIETTDFASVPVPERASANEVGPGIWQVTLTFGYGDAQNVPEALMLLQDDLDFDGEDLSYFLGLETVVSSPRPVMNGVSERIFVLQRRLAASAARFFHLPADRVFEVGRTVEI